MLQVLGPQPGRGMAEETTWWLRAAACALAERLGVNPATRPATARERMEARTKSFILVTFLIFLKKFAHLSTNQSIVVGWVNYVPSSYYIKYITVV
jgi:hypothetical protein